MSAVDWRLLKKVSRSFYLTLYWLPQPVRDSIALAYLLARLTDTQADGVATEGERELMQRESLLVEALSRSPDRREIEEVWRTIQEGQEFDRVRFTGPSPEPLSAAELDRYTYLVAGCVGEFWTRICTKHLPGYSRLDESKMRSLGVDYGKGLQLINILRDRTADRSLGRIYLKDDTVSHYLRIARGHMNSAETYVRAITIRRLRMATVLPMLIGRDTLDLLEAAPQAVRVKVSRSRVWCHLMRSLFY